MLFLRHLPTPDGRPPPPISKKDDDFIFNFILIDLWLFFIFQKLEEKKNRPTFGQMAGSALKCKRGLLPQVKQKWNSTRPVHNRNALSSFENKTEIPDMLESWIMSDSVCTGETQSRFWDSSLAPTEKKKLLEQKLFDDKQGARSESREQAKVTKRKIDVQGGHWAQGWEKKEQKLKRTTSFIFFS